jgi:hypothetical protein
MSHTDSVDAMAVTPTCCLHALGTRPRCDRPPVGAQA